MPNTTNAYNGPNKRYKSELCSGLSCEKHDFPTQKRTRDDNCTSSLRTSSWTRGLVAGLSSNIRDALERNTVQHTHKLRTVMPACGVTILSGMCDVIIVLMN